MSNSNSSGGGDGCLVSMAVLTGGLLLFGICQQSLPALAAIGAIIAIIGALGILAALGNTGS